MPATAIILVPPKFFMCYEICVTGTWNSALLFIITGTGVLVFKKNRNRRAGSFVVENAALENWNILFLPRRGAFLRSAFASFDVCHEFIHGQWQSCRTTINDDSNAFTMRLPENV